MTVDRFREDLAGRDALIGVVGLGYVGLPVAVSFVEAGFSVLGIETNKEKVDAMLSGRSAVHDVSDERLAAAVESGALRLHESYEPLGDAAAVIICVPTPITEGTPDLSYVVAVGEGLGRVLKAGTLVVLESTTYPGTTEELLRPLIEAGGLTAGKDLFLAFSPERIDPGNSVYSFSDIPKVVGGMDEVSTALATALYEQVVPKVVAVSGTREAELSKLIENTFRHVNIALVNELAVYSFELGIDIWEAIEAAATKPFGFMPFWPSPGWGGHCIPLDPSYLSWRVRQDRAHEVRFVELAQAVNSEMPRHVVERVSLLLNDHGKAIRGAKIFAVGVAYKAGTDDVRESAAHKILGRLKKLGAEIAFHDPLVDRVAIGDEDLEVSALTPELVGAQDLVLIFIPQVGVDWVTLESSAKLILDCCNALGRKGGKVTRL